MHSTDPPDVQSVSNCRYKGLMFLQASFLMHLEGRRQLTYAFIRSIPFHITVAQLFQMKSVVWLPGARQTTRHLLQVPNLSSSQCVVTPIARFQYRVCAHALNRG